MPSRMSAKVAQSSLCRVKLAGSLEKTQGIGSDTHFDACKKYAPLAEPSGVASALVRRVTTMAVPALRSVMQAGAASPPWYPTIGTGALNGACDQPWVASVVAHGSGTCHVTPVKLVSAKNP